jgi:hypothetical protein
MPDEDWAVPANLTICLIFPPQNNVFWLLCPVTPQFLGNWGQAKLLTFWGTSLTSLASAGCRVAARGEPAGFIFTTSPTASAAASPARHLASAGCRVAARGEPACFIFTIDCTLRASARHPTSLVPMALPAHPPSLGAHLRPSFLPPPPHSPPTTFSISHSLSPLTHPSISPLAPPFGDPPPAHTHASLVPSAEETKLCSTVVSTNAI